MPTPAQAFHQAERQRVGGLQQHEQHQQRVLWPPAAAAAPAAPAAALPSRHHHHRYAPATSNDFRRLKPGETPELALALVEQDNAAALELARLHQKAAAAAAAAEAAAAKGDDDDDDDPDERFLALCARNHENDAEAAATGTSSAATATVASFCRTSLDATAPPDWRAALLTLALLPLCAAILGIAAGAALLATVTAYAQTSGRVASIVGSSSSVFSQPSVWTTALRDAFASHTGAPSGCVLQALSAAGAALASFAAAFPLPWASPYQASSPHLGEADWAVVAILAAAAHLAGLAGAPAEVELATAGTRPSLARTPIMWHGATVARCALLLSAWIAACCALSRRAWAGERAARRGRAAAWRAAVATRALLLGGGAGSD